MREAAAESWVLGPEAASRQGAGDSAARLESDVLALYAEEYVRAWQAAVGDLSVQRFRDARTLPRLRARANGDGFDLDVRFNGCQRRVRAHGAALVSICNVCADTMHGYRYVRMCNTRFEETRRLRR